MCVVSSFRAIVIYISILVVCVSSLFLSVKVVPPIAQNVGA